MVSWSQFKSSELLAGLEVIIVWWNEAVAAVRETGFFFQFLRTGRAAKSDDSRAEFSLLS